MVYALIVDDEDMLREVISRQVMRKDYNTIEANSVISALETVAEHGHPGLVVSDTNMPGLWGSDLTALLRGIPPEEYIRIFNGNAKVPAYDEAYGQFHGKISRYEGPILLLSGSDDNPVPNKLKVHFEMKPIYGEALYTAIAAAEGIVANGFSF